jgi:soluble lytic murein transglycosylase-like protein
LNILGKAKRIAAVMAVAVCSMAVGNTNVASAEDFSSVAIANYVAMHNNSLSYEDAKAIADGITYYSNMYGVDPLLMTALFHTESHFNQDSISGAGAIGIGQIMPDTAVSLGVNPYDTMQNIEGACSYMSTALKNFADWPYPTEAALAAYNAGSNAVIKYGGVPPFAETQNYVVTIRDRYNSLRGIIDGPVTVVDSTHNMGSSYAVNNGVANYVEYVEQDYPVGDILDAEDD